MITIDNVTNGERDSLQTKLDHARSWAFSMKQVMRGEIEQISLTKPNEYPNRPHNDVRDKLTQAVEDYTQAVARVAVLEMLATEDFFLAVAHSASKIGES